MHHSPKLEVWTIFFEGLTYPFRNLSIAIRASIPSILFAFIIILLGFLVDYVPPITPENMGGAIAMFAMSHIAVGIHRAILLGETNLQIFRFGRPEILYFAALLILRTLYDLPQFALDLEIWAYRFLIIIAFAINVCALTILPAIAISDHSMRLKNVWYYLAGSRLRFMLVVFLSTALSWAGVSAGGPVAEFGVQEVFRLMTDYEISFAPGIFIILLCLLFATFAGAILIAATASILSGIYKFIVQQAMLNSDTYNPPDSLLK